MGKKGILFLIVICMTILSTALVAAGNESIELKLNEQTTVSGVTIYFHALVNNAEAMFKFNGKTIFLKRGEVTKVSGMTATLDQVLNKADETRAWITVTIPFVCGDNTCEENEKNYCCSDCGCPDGYDCTEDQCIKAELNECTKNSDCKASSPCEKPSCEGAPRKCVYKKIDECRHGDKCCPAECTSYAKDNDCKQFIECTKPEECDDKDPTTNDYCSVPDAKCYHSKINKKQTEQNVSSAAAPSNASTITNASKTNATGGDLANPETFKSSKETIFIVIIVLLVLILMVLGILMYLKLKKDKKSNHGYVVPEKVVVEVKDKPASDSDDEAELHQEPEEHSLTKEEKESLKEPVIIKKDEYKSYEKVHQTQKQKELEKQRQKQLEEEKKKAKLHPLLKKVEEHNKKFQDKHSEEKLSKTKT
ncbi:hypothetical protein HYY69_00860 [Candidatus Woesearchaeota archaeon]|nr:hypothetical protein [Candidatus Woesearchaeota archaeon]